MPHIRYDHKQHFVDILFIYERHIIQRIIIPECTTYSTKIKEKMSFFRWMICVIFEEHMCGLWYYVKKKKVGFEILFYVGKGKRS